MNLQRGLSAACLSVFIAVASVPSHAQTKLKVGVVSFSESLGAVVADKKGYFKEEGLEVEMTQFQAAAAAIPVLQSKRLDICISTPVSTFQAVEQGIDLNIIASAAIARKQSPDTTLALLVREGTLSSAKELDGKRIAVNAMNSAAWLQVVADLDQVYGVNRNTLRFVELPFPQMNDALMTGQVDAIGQVEPFRSVALSTGKVKVLAWPYIETTPGADTTHYVALGSWVAKNRDVVVRFARAVHKAAAFINANGAEAREINQAFTGLNPALKDVVLLPEFGTSVNSQGTEATMRLALKYGLIKSPIDVADRIVKNP